MTCLKRLSDNLGQTLCETAALAAKVRYFSWNVKGHHAWSLRDMLANHHREVQEIVDNVVTCVFLNGYDYCYGGFKDMAGRASIPDGTVETGTDDMIAQLLSSYDVVLIAVEKVHRIAMQQGNFAVEKLLVDGILTLKRHMADLRAARS